jgi:hypothetical protein
MPYPVRKRSARLFVHAQGLMCVTGTGVGLWNTVTREWPRAKRGSLKAAVTDRGATVRAHCFISTSRGDKGPRWAWHAADERGIATRSSESLFANFNECVDDARAHGFHHVEVPVLDWSATAQDSRPASADGSSDVDAAEGEAGSEA